MNRQSRLADYFLVSEWLVGWMDVETRADKDSITVQFFKNKLPTRSGKHCSRSFRCRWGRAKLCTPLFVCWDNWRMHGYNRMVPGFLFYLLYQILIWLWLTKFQFWLLLLEFYCKKYSDFPYLIKLMFLFPVWTIWHGQKVQLLNLSVFHFTLHLMSSKPF